MDKLMLIDGNSLTYRAFFALPTDMATAHGQVTNAVYGFTSMLINLLRDHRPDHVAVAFDRPEPTFRHEQVEEYKATREAAPDILRQQMGLVREVAETLRIPIIEQAGFEADDIIATLATKARDAGMETIIVTGDRDSYQLVQDPHIRVLYNRRGVSDYVLYDEAGILERVGVPAASYPEYAALRGDPSDNLPGVPGIGEKTAAKLITTYGTLEGIFEHLDDLPPKQRTNLGEFKDRVFKNRDMSRLALDVDCGAEPANLRQGAFDREKVRVLFNQLEFRTLLPRLMEALGDVAEAEPDADTFEVEVVRARDAKAAVAAINDATKAARVAVEARWVGAAGGAVAGIGLSAGDGATYIDGD